MLTVADLVTGARVKFNDTPSDHFSRETLNSQIFDGNQSRFRTLNRNIIDAAAGAPADPAILVQGSPVVPTSFDFVSGVFVLASQPAVNATLQAEYYFLLISDADYLEFAKDASRFVGTEPVFTALTDQAKFDPLLAEAAELYMAGLAAKKMSNLASWYYDANAGNKSFNKGQIATNFKNMAKEFQEEAMKKREDVYTRHSQREAPAFGYTNMPGVLRPFPPRR